MESAPQWPESDDHESDYWDEQRKRPLSARGRGWWAEEGAPYIAGALLVLVLLVLLVFF